MSAIFVSLKGQSGVNSPPLDLQNVPGLSIEALRGGALAQLVKGGNIGLLSVSQLRQLNQPDLSKMYADSAEVSRTLFEYLTTAGKLPDLTGQQIIDFAYEQAPGALAKVPATRLLNGLFDHPRTIFSQLNARQLRETVQIRGAAGTSTAILLSMIPRLERPHLNAVARVASTVLISPSDAKAEFNTLTLGEQDEVLRSVDPQEAMALAPARRQIDPVLRVAAMVVQEREAAKTEFAALTAEQQDRVLQLVSVDDAYALLGAIGGNAGKTSALAAVISTSNKTRLAGTVTLPELQAMSTSTRQALYQCAFTEADAQRLFGLSLAKVRNPGSIVSEDIKPSHMPLRDALFTVLLTAEQAIAVFGLTLMQLKGLATLTASAILAAITATPPTIRAPQLNAIISVLKSDEQLSIFGVSDVVAYSGSSSTDVSSNPAPAALSDESYALLVFASISNAPMEVAPSANAGAINGPASSVLSALRFSAWGVFALQFASLTVVNANLPPQPNTPLDPINGFLQRIRSTGVAGSVSGSLNFFIGMRRLTQTRPSGTSPLEDARDYVSMVGQLLTPVSVASDYSRIYKWSNSRDSILARVKRTLGLPGPPPQPITHGPLPQWASELGSADAVRKKFAEVQTEAERLSVFRRAQELDTDGLTDELFKKWKSIDGSVPGSLLSKIGAIGDLGTSLISLISDAIELDLALKLPDSAQKQERVARAAMGLAMDVVFTGGSVLEIAGAFGSVAAMSAALPVFTAALVILIGMFITDAAITAARDSNLLTKLYYGQQTEMASLNDMPSYYSVKESDVVVPSAAINLKVGQIIKVVIGTETHYFAPRPRPIHPIRSCGREPWGD